MATQDEIKFVGVDGCSSGWFSISFSEAGCWEVNVFTTFAELLAYYASARIILVDIPIGLLEGPGSRHCDIEARTELGEPRRRSVFPAPTRQTVQQVAMWPDNYAAASQTEHQHSLRWLSKQSFYLAPKISELDELLPREEPPQVREIHPEVCFWALNHRVAMQYGKKEMGQIGIQERIAVLNNVEPRTQKIFDAALAGCRRADVARDDILDALAAAVTAYRGWPNHFQTLPFNNPQIDGKGLPLEMVFWEPPRPNEEQP
jgi:predicted RNase H-like nuclease